MSAREPSNSFRPRRWLRFSLRTLLIVVTLFGVWLGVKVDQARRQKLAVVALRMRGFYVNYEHWRTNGDPESFDSSRELPVPTLLRSRADGDFFQKVIAIRVLPTSSDDDYVHLAALPHIEALYLSGRGNDVSDAGLAYLPRPDRLVHFEAGDTLVGDAFVKRLANATGLIRLGLSGTRVTDKGLQWLPPLPKLKMLGLGGTSTTDAGLAAALQDRSSLESLYLQDTRITDKSVALLEDANRLRFLHLDRTQISDAGLIHLQNAKRLITLSLEQTKITDAGLRQLHGLPALKGLCVNGTRVTSEGVAALKAATPSLRVVQE
jgi:hypothetical protein